jgi:uncharacterized protein
MDFEWDASKRLANILKHGIDFVDAIGIFTGHFEETEDLRRDYGERRTRTFGEIDGQVLHVVSTWRDDRRRIISARRARRNERRTYYAGLAEAGQKDER